MICFLALVLEVALRRKLKELGKEVRYQDLLLHLSEVRAVEVELGGRRYPVRTELVGPADLAFKALHTGPPQHVAELPCSP